VRIALKLVYRESGGETDAKRHGMRIVRILAILIAVVASSVSIVDAVTHAEPSENHINTVREIRAALRACWVRPTTEVPRANITISVRLSFKQNGEILGIPLITYTTLGISEDERRAYRAALNETLARCSRLRSPMRSAA
jgi:hypothetical protein